MAPKGIVLDELKEKAVGVDYQPQVDPAATGSIQSASQKLLKLPGVVAVGLGESDSLVVFVKSSAAATLLPSSVGGLRIKPKVSGEIGLY